MYKLKKEFLGQNIRVFTPNKQVINLETAEQDELEKAFKQGLEKYIQKTHQKKQEPKKQENKKEEIKAPKK
jgi:predicted HicB family RNase H-like nuclease